MIRLEPVIFALAAGVSLIGYLPLFSWLEPFPRLLLPGALLFALVSRRRGFTLDSRLLTAGSVALFLVYLVRVTRTDLVGPVVNLLVALLGVRFLGERNGRTYLQIFLLALFCLAASSLYSLDALFMLYLGLQVALFETALVLLACYGEDPSATLTRSRLRALLSVSLAMLFLSVPLLLAFFVILPRTQFPLWESPAGPSGRKSGFSESVQPGSAAAVAESRTVAFRAECDRLPPADLYWRGITLNRFDGTAWTRREPPAPERFIPGTGKVVPQRLFLEPGSSRYLVALDLPGQVAGLRGIATAPDFTLTRRSVPTRRSTYEVASTLAGSARGVLGTERGFYLETPERLSPRLRELGRRLGGSGATDGERLAAVEAFFLGGRFIYATTGLPVSQEPLVEFLAAKRRGNCEFFASSCALLLRLAGVPARLVGGYLGGEHNGIGGYYVVTEERAHVWVEAYLEGKGWVRVDPSRWAVNAGEVGAPAGRGSGRSLLLALDAITYFWNRQVITYDLERQIALFNEAGQRLHGARPPPRGVLLRYGLLAALPFLLWWVVQVVRRRPSREERLVAAFLDRLRRVHGVEGSADRGLRELTQGIDAPGVARFVELYGGALYRDRALTPGELKELRGIVRRMKAKS